MAGRKYRVKQGKTQEGLHALLWPVRSRRWLVFFSYWTGYLFLTDFVSSRSRGSSPDTSRNTRLSSPDNESLSWEQAW